MADKFDTPCSRLAPDDSVVRSWWWWDESFTPQSKEQDHRSFSQGSHPILFYYVERIKKTKKQSFLVHLGIFHIVLPRPWQQLRRIFFNSNALFVRQQANICSNHSAFTFVLSQSDCVNRQKVIWEIFPHQGLCRLTAMAKPLCFAKSYFP